MASENPQVTRIGGRKRLRLVLSCGNELHFDPIVLDMHGMEDGDTGWCPEHDDATIDAMFVEDDDD